MSLREQLGLEQPIVGAGLGGGLSRAKLTVAIAEVGGLGQLGIMPPPMLRAELAAHRERSARPIAVNLLLPFARRGHWELAREADAVVTFWGKPRRATNGVWVHQCGSVEEAKAAADAGADGVIVQGVEAGGHVRGTTPALELLERARAALAPRFPIWLAGGVAERADVEAALAAGAEAVVVGTRFLLSDESDAHPEYKRRLLEAHDTVLTELFGAGWPAPSPSGAQRGHRALVARRRARPGLGPRPASRHRSCFISHARSPHPARGPLAAARHAAARTVGRHGRRSGPTPGFRPALCGRMRGANTASASGG